MAKYTRYDPQNKQQGRNKQRSIERDLRIREIDKKDRLPLLREVVYDEYNDEELDLNGYQTLT